MNLTDLENKFFYKNTPGNTGNLEERKRIYFKSQGATGKGVDELERSWLYIKIYSLGGVPNSKYLPDLWAHLLGISGFSVSPFVNQNKINFYSNS